ncbi:hypothetical protein QOT17_021438 [Balamuthia mandrillaris]
MAQLLGLQHRLAVLLGGREAALRTSGALTIQLSALLADAQVLSGLYVLEEVSAALALLHGPLGPGALLAFAVDVTIGKATEGLPGVLVDQTDGLLLLDVLLQV